MSNRKQYQPPEKIAKLFATGGSVSVAEARILAESYLRQQELVTKLSNKALSLQGGEEIVQKVEVGDMRAHSFRRKSGTHDYHISELSEMNDLIGHVVDISRVGDEYRIKGAKDHVKRYLRIAHLIAFLLQRAYNEGFQDGRNLLAGLADGSIAAGEYNVKTGGRS